MTQTTATKHTPESTSFVDRMNAESLCIAALSIAFDKAVMQFGATRLAHCIRESEPSRV